MVSNFYVPLEYFFINKQCPGFSFLSLFFSLAAFGSYFLGSLEMPGTVLYLPYNECSTRLGSCSSPQEEEGESLRLYQLSIKRLTLACSRHPQYQKCYQSLFLFWPMTSQAYHRWHWFPYIHILFYRTGLHHRLSFFVVSFGKCVAIRHRTSGAAVIPHVNHITAFWLHNGL